MWQFLQYIRLKCMNPELQQIRTAVNAKLPAVMQNSLSNE